MIAGASIANPRRIMKKVSRTRANASLHCSDGLKDELMKTTRSFADSTISTYFPSVDVRGAVGGCQMGRWQHLSDFRERSHFIDQSQDLRRLSSALSYCERRQRTVESVPPVDLAGGLQKSRSMRGPRTDPWGTPLKAGKAKDEQSWTQTRNERCARND